MAFDLFCECKNQNNEKVFTSNMFTCLECRVVFTGTVDIG